MDREINKESKLETKKGVKNPGGPNSDVGAEEVKEED